MKIKTNFGHVTIDDNSDIAQKIMSGYSYEVNELGEIIIGEKDKLDLTDIKKKLKKTDVLTDDQIKKTLLFIINELIEIKYK